MKAQRSLLCLLLALLLLAAFPVTAQAAFGPGGKAYRYPTITVLAYHAPADLTVQVEVPKNGEPSPESTRRVQRLWEQSFFLYREDVFRANSFKGNETDFAGSVLICSAGGEEHRVPIQKACLTVGGSRDVMTLDCRSWTLSPGLPAWRTALIVAIRVLLVLAVKALLFLLLGYRERQSWLWMLGLCLATQIPLSLILGRWIWVNDTNWNSAMLVGVMIMCLAAILVLETLVLALQIQEKDRDRTGLFVGCSNAAAIGVLVATLIWLPV